MKDLNAPEPAPSSGEGPEIWPLIYDSPGLILPDWLRADMRARHQLGVAKYGTGLRVWNGRDAVVDAYQEALDLVVYTRQARERLGKPTKKDLLFGVINGLEFTVHIGIHTAIRLGELARSGKVPVR